jgi:hypothetical protein
VIGRRLGSYEVVAKLGEGGMGEVYRARDLKLNRDVALKVLPAAFTLDPDRLARFRREAQLLASINHPNIATIYDFEESDGVQALVLELVDGPTLWELIDRAGGLAPSADRQAQSRKIGGIPLDEALPIARQIAEALEAAHELGIIHRDLKPANIKLRPDGVVKVLDFGLAKALEPTADLGGHPTSSPTMTSPAMTERGVILGTALYMSPEQSKGRPVDRRSDVWAFGAVLFEMLSGQRAFKGDDRAETLAAVLRADPPWTSLPPETPPSIHRLLRRCLQKDPKLRLQHVGDARLELVDVEKGEADGPVIPAVPSRRQVWPLVAAATVGALGVGLAAWMLAPRPPVGEVTRFVIQPPASAPLVTRGGGIALSPDGRLLVYASAAPFGLIKHRLDEFGVEPVRGGEGGSWPFFSPDGAWIGFFADGKLKKVSAAGGLAVTICDAPPNARGAWGDDGTIVVARTDLYKVASSGGTLNMIFDPGDGQVSQPEFLPGSKAVLVQIRVPPNVGHIEAVDLETRTRHRLTEGSSPKLAATGDLLFARERRIWALRFDAQRLAVIGAPVPFVESVSLFENTDALFAGSSNGSLAYISGTGETAGVMVWLDRTGKWTAALDEQHAFFYPRLSPVDGKRVAVSVNGESAPELWTFDLDRGSRTKLTTEGSNRRTVWSPDGTHIAYFSLPPETQDQDLYVISSSGGSPKLLLQRRGPQWPDAWSPDGKFLVFEEGPTGASRDLWVLPFGGDPRPLVADPRFNERSAVFSPDGHWLAFVSDESGRPEVYLLPFPGLGQKIPISTNGGV